MDKIVLTVQGMQKLKDELNHLKKVDRPEVIERIKTARELGDLSENADYANAREQQSFIEGRILELEEKLKLAEIVDVGSSSSTVCVGHQVTINCNGKEEIYHIVGENEIDPIQRKVSVNSPIGEALLGKKIGDEVTVKVPAGIKTCKVIKIS